MGFKRVVVASLIPLIVVSLFSVYATRLDVSVVVSDETPVNIFVNGINLDDKIEQLEGDVQDLYNKLTSTTISIFDLTIYYLYKDKLLDAYNTILNGLYSKLQKTNNTEEKEKIMEQILQILRKERKVESMTDKLLLKALMDLRKQEEVASYPDLGWWDIYNEHHNFDELVAPYSPIDLRITDCYSEIGRSHVIRGGKITITGIVYRYGTITSNQIRVTLLDPESGFREKLILMTPPGENKTLNGVEIRWTSPSVFELTIDTKELRPGLKIVNITYPDPLDGVVNVKCPFKVLQPYLNAEKFGNFLVVKTNVPTIVVKYNGLSQVYKVLNHKLYVYVGNATTPITVEGVGSYSFVKTVID